jgi:hypothetical protein
LLKVFFFYSYNLISFDLSNLISDDNKYLIHKLYINSNFFSYDLCVSLLITQLYYISIYTTPYFNEFFKHLLNSVDYTDFFFIHPEIYFIVKDYSNIYSIFCTEISTAVCSNYIRETFVHPFFVLIEIVSFFMLVIYFAIIYFSYYNNSTTEENLIDHDYLSNSLTVESEEEIGSFDDTVLSLVLFTLLFFWFF